MPDIAVVMNERNCDTLGSNIIECAKRIGLHLASLKTIAIEEPSHRRRPDSSLSSDLEESAWHSVHNANPKPNCM
jgi:hypothetical protein